MLKGKYCILEGHTDTTVHEENPGGHNSLINIGRAKFVESITDIPTSKRTYAGDVQFCPRIYCSILYAP